MSLLSPTFSINNEQRIQVLDRLYRYSDFEKRRSTPYSAEFYHLNHINKILSLLNNPQNSFRSLHIAGTKGKGSTVYLLAYLLEEMGVHTGHTVSPQLIDERDRFYHRGKKSSWEEIIPVFDEVLEVVETSGIIPTVFDIFTSVAFLYFHRQSVDIAVVETGLGGRWDSTNSLLPQQLVAGLITLIDFDHTDKLGNTLPLIAKEKAGIIKTGVPVFTLNTEESVFSVIRDQADQVGAPVYLVDKVHPLLKGIRSEEFPIYVPVSTRANLNLAVTCLTHLGYPLTGEHILKVVGRLPLPGRYHKSENILIDGAHTVYSLRSFVSAIKLDPTLKDYRRVKIFFYCLYDKDIAGLVQEIPKEWELAFFDPDLHYIDAEKVCEVKKIVEMTWGKKVNTVTDFSTLKWKEETDCLYVFTGSFKLAGNILSQLSRLHKV